MKRFRKCEVARGIEADGELSGNGRAVSRVLASKNRANAT
jgi:hypothetical protein